MTITLPEMTVVVTAPQIDPTPPAAPREIVIRSPVGTPVYRPGLKVTLHKLVKRRDGDATQRTALAADTPKRSAAAWRDRPPTTVATNLDLRSMESGLPTHAGLQTSVHQESHLVRVAEALMIFIGQISL